MVRLESNLMLNEHLVLYHEIDRTKVKEIGVGDTCDFFISLKVKPATPWFVRKRVRQKFSNDESAVWMIGIPGKLLWIFDDGTIEERAKFSEEALYSRPHFREDENWPKLKE